jgi:hypothetical protein
MISSGTTAIVAVTIAGVVIPLRRLRLADYHRDVCLTTGEYAGPVSLRSISSSGMQSAREEFS